MRAKETPCRRKAQASSRSWGRLKARADLGQLLYGPVLVWASSWQAGPIPTRSWPWPGRAPRSSWKATLAWGRGQADRVECSFPFTESRRPSSRRPPAACSQNPAYYERPLALTPHHPLKTSQFRLASRPIRGASLPLRRPEGFRGLRGVF